MILLLALLVSNYLMAAPSNWVGIYKHANNEDRIAIDDCKEKSCDVWVYTSSKPRHFLADCPAAYNYGIKGADLVLHFKNSQGEKTSAKIMYGRRGQIVVESTGLLPVAIENPLCQLEAGSYKKLFDHPEDPEVVEKLSVCHDVNDVLWVPVCSDPVLKKYVLAYVSDEGEDAFVKAYKKNFGRKFASRTDFQTLPHFVIDLLYEKFKGSRPEPKILKETKYEGIYETQRLSFGEGLSNWSTSLHFSNCKKDKCDYVQSHCSGLNFSQSDCEEIRGVATFENETTIRMKEICEEKNVLLEKKNEKWELNLKGCRIPYQIEGPEALEKLSQVTYQASFNCLSSKLSDVENLICSSYSLSQADLWLMDIYKKMKAKKKKVDDQSQWLRDRKKCSDSEFEECLMTMYQKRIVDWVLELKK